MAVAKIVQIIQFYCGGNTPHVVQKLIERIYPLVAQNKAAWKKLNYQQPSNNTVIFRLIIIGVACIIAIAGTVRLQKSKKMGCYSLFAIWVALFYTLSYCVCTPTPDARYLSSAVMILLASIPVYGICALKNLSTTHKAHQATNISKD